MNKDLDNLRIAIIKVMTVMHVKTNTFVVFMVML